MRSRGSGLGSSCSVQEVEGGVVGVADGHRQGVRGILGGNGIQFEQGAHHVLHLPLFRLAVPGALH